MPSSFPPAPNFPMPSYAGQPQSTSPEIPIDPTLSMFPTQSQQHQFDFGGFPPPTRQQVQHPYPSFHGQKMNNQRSQDSDETSDNSPPYASSSNVQQGPSDGHPNKSAGKRPNDKSQAGPRKKRKDGDPNGVDDDEPEKEKTKSTRGSRACTVCRRLKMKCVGAEQGPPCKRCQTGNHECIFEESNRGKRSSKKHEVLTRSLRKMEQTLDTVLRSLANPHLQMQSLTSGMVSRSPSPGSTKDADDGPQVSPSIMSHSLSHQSNSHLTRQTQNLTSHIIGVPVSPESPHTSISVHRTPLTHAESPKLPQLPDNSLNPLGLLAEASLANRREGNFTSREKVGVASDAYFKPGPMSILPLRRLYIERQVQPEMLNFVSTQEVVDLFRIYFDEMNYHCSLLDRNFHTPSLVCSRSPFLLTTICAISSQFYSARPDLHAKLNKIAKKLAFSVPEQGFKSVEIVQAYLLLSLWGCGPVERFEQDKTWIILGLAIRMGTDLNLHRKSQSGPKPDDMSEADWKGREREIRNRERTWLLCFALDRSFSAQMGKPHSVKEDFIIRNASQWWKEPEALPNDLGLVTYVQLQRIVSRSLDFLHSGTSTPSGLHTDCDYLLVIKTIETQLKGWYSDWDPLLNITLGHTNPEAITDKKLFYIAAMARFYYHYAVLVVNAFGLQNALERAKVDIGHFFGKCHTSAITCATIVRDVLGPRGYLRTSPDSHFVLSSYAVLTLLKLIRPEFQAFTESEQRTVALVKDVSDLLESIAANPLHTPALYSTFLRALITAKMDPSVPPTPAPHQHRSVSRNGPVFGSGGAAGPSRSGANYFDRRAQKEAASLGGPSISFPEEGGGGAGGGGADGVLGLKMFQPSGDGTLAGENDFMLNGDMDLGGFQSLSNPTGQMQNDDGFGLMSMDSILSSGFWDSVLIPGYSSALEGLSGGFVYGAGGSGFITPRRGASPDLAATADGGTGAPPTTSPQISTQMDQNTRS